MRNVLRILVVATSLVAPTAAAQQPGPRAGETAPAPAAPVRAIDARVVRSLHLDVLGRPPLRAEAAACAGLAYDEVVDRLLDAPEFWPRWFEEQLYYFLLVNNFRPQGERLVAIPEELRAGTIDPRAAIHRLALSSNFDQRNPGADTFVTVVMEQLLGLEVQKSARELEIGKRLYDGGPGTFLGVAGNSQADVVRIAVGDAAFARHFVGREHERLVHARLDGAAWTRDAAEFRRDPTSYRALVRRWLLSDLYAKRLVDRVALSNRLFVRALYVDLFDRTPTEAEAEPMRQALDGLSDPTPLRSVLVRMMLDSGRVEVPARAAIGDPESWTRAQFVRFLSREPTTEERATFVAALADPACRPQTVLCALLTSAEYQSY